MNRCVLTSALRKAHLLPRLSGKESTGHSPLKPRERHDLILNARPMNRSGLQSLWKQQLKQKEIKGAEVMTRNSYAQMPVLSPILPGLKD